MIFFLLGYTSVHEAKAEWQYKYNHHVVPSIDSQQTVELQQGFSLGASPFSQGPLLTASYNYFGKKQLGVGLEQKIAEQYSVRSQVVFTDTGTGLSGQLFWHMESQKPVDPSHVEYTPRKTEIHHGAILSGGATQNDWWIGVGYHFGFSNMDFRQ